MEDMYERLTEDAALCDLWENYQAEISKNNITAPGTISELFENRRFKMMTNTLPGTGDKNDIIEDANNNEAMNNVSTRNEILIIKLLIGTKLEHSMLVLIKMKCMYAGIEIIIFQKMYNPT